MGAKARIVQMNMKVTRNHVVQDLIHNAKERSRYTGSDGELLQDFKKGIGTTMFVLSYSVSR